MNTYSFSVILAENDLSEPQAEALYADGCEDSTPGVSCGRAYVDFDRRARSLPEAIASAIRQIKAARLTPIGIEPDDLVTQSEIAERCRLSRQCISNYVLKKRGGLGGFPPPVARVTTGSPLRRWTDVSKWLAARRLLPAGAVEAAETLARFNGTLQAARLKSGTGMARRAEKVALRRCADRRKRRGASSGAGDPDRDQGARTRRS